MASPAQALEPWLDAQLERAVRGMLMSVSPLGIIKSRPGFGQTVRPHRGSVVASPVLADWDPEPDYFFHWFRDSAVVMDALRLLFESRHLGAEAVTHFADFVDFSLSLRALDGPTLLAERSWRERCSTEFEKFLRSESDLASVRGEIVVAEARVNADATLDFSSWGRPQHDGAPMRALVVLRWTRAAPLEPRLKVRVWELLRADLAFTASYWREPSYDIWEEDKGLHYYTLCVSAAALEEGARWLEGEGETELAQSYLGEARSIRDMLEELWLPESGHYRSRVLSSGARSVKELDISVILAAIHADGDRPAHTVCDPRMHRTLERLEALFDAAYPINRSRPKGLAPAMGRYDGDVYFSGGAYYFSTLGAAEFCFRAACRCENAAAWSERGDAFLRTVRAYTPADGQMSEQFDQRTGEQSSARHLAWSYACFISCVAARRAAAGRT
ncbi:MAG TPA: glycoside hydrolase family 15 protein [Steroidobacteraceae bacterium]|nr:glycoside hydrolase family 15 protein [Steroidobacteraceae bacterium]